MRDNLSRSRLVAVYALLIDLAEKLEITARGEAGELPQAMAQSAIVNTSSSVEDTNTLLLNKMVAQDEHAHAL